MGRSMGLMVALYALSSVNIAHALCGLPLISAETTTTDLPISGCYQKSPYMGLYETPVYTIEGRDVADTGTTAILATNEYSDSSDPTWAIGSVISLPTNSWSDGYSAGLDIVRVVCVSNSTFWQATDPDPTDVEIWKCDTNGDGILSLEERGDFEKMKCGCAESGAATPSPIVVEATPSPIVVEGPATTTLAPVPAVVPTSAPGAVQPPMAVPATLAPSSFSGPIAQAARECNLTLTSETLSDARGCYVGTSSSNARGRWVQQNTQATIYWKEPESTDEIGLWIIETGIAGIRCMCDQDVDNPSEIDPPALWKCLNDQDGTYSADQAGDDFQGLKCTSGFCRNFSGGNLAPRDLDGASGSSFSSRKGIVVSLSVVGSVMLLGVLAFAFVIGSRKKKRGIAQGTAAVKQRPGPEDGSVSPGDSPAAPAPVVFEPWGTRPPPKTYK